MKTINNLSYTVENIFWNFNMNTDIPFEERVKTLKSELKSKLPKGCIIRIEHIYRDEMIKEFNPHNLEPDKNTVSDHTFSMYHQWNVLIKD